MLLSSPTLHCAYKDDCSMSGEMSHEYVSDVDNIVIYETAIDTEFIHDNCGDGVYLFAEWSSSTGLLFSILLMYIGLVTVTNIIVVYKFIATWNQITVSLREQNRVCVKYANIPAIRRQTCQEALKPCLYYSENNHSTSCPICLTDIQDQDYVVSCTDGCNTTYHKNCLYDWLDFKSTSDDVLSENHKSCPCCRKELIGIVPIESTQSNSTSGFISDLSTLVGYYPY